MYICIYIYMYIYICKYIYICMYVCMYVLNLRKHDNHPKKSQKKLTQAVRFYRASWAKFMAICGPERAGGVYTYMKGWRYSPYLSSPPLPRAVLGQRIKHLTGVDQANEGTSHYVSKLMRIPGKIWQSSMMNSAMPGDFMHNCAMHELPMLEVQSNAKERR